MHCFSCVLQNNLYHLIHLHIQFHTVCRRHIIRHLEYKYQAGAPSRRNRTLIGGKIRIQQCGLRRALDRLVQYNRELRADTQNIKTHSVRPELFNRKLFGLTTVETKLLFKAAVALILFTSSVIAEIIRGGLNSIAHGQFEAGHAQGFNVVQVMIYIILPQAYRNVIPTLLSQVITTIKDSSYLANVATIELMARTKQLLSAASRYNGTGNVNVSDVFVLFGVAALIYFIINYTLSCVVRTMQKRRKRPVRVTAD